MRAPGKDGEVKLSEAEYAYLDTVENAKKGNIKNGVYSNKGFRLDGLGSDILKKGDGLMGQFNVRALNSTEIDEWFKTQPKKSKVTPKKSSVVNTVAAPPVTLAAPSYEGARNIPVRSTDYIREMQAIQKPREEAEREARVDAYQEPDPSGRSLAERARAASTPTQTKEAKKQEQQANVSATGSSSKPNNSAAAYSGSVQGKEFGRAKGGLIKKPKKKKTKKY